jgi:hypothetical protein
MKTNEFILLEALKTVLRNAVLCPVFELFSPEVPRHLLYHVSQSDSAIQVHVI